MKTLTAATDKQIQEIYDRLERIERERKEHLIAMLIKSSNGLKGELTCAK